MTMWCLKEAEDTLLPENSKNCKPECLNLYNNKPVTIYPKRINIIDAGITIEMPPKCVIQVKNHICNKPWRILNEYLYPDPDTKLLKIPVITQHKCIINYGDILCHMQVVLVEDIYKRIAGKKFVNCINNVYKN